MPSRARVLVTGMKGDRNGVGRAPMTSPVLSIRCHVTGVPGNQPKSPGQGTVHIPIPGQKVVL